MKRLLTILIILGLLLPASTFAEGDEDEEKQVHEFELLHKVKTTPVKSQDRTGTCWSFATTSFVETELLRMGSGEYDLSEMFFVRKKYSPRAEMYIRLHGRFNFGPGGQAHDVMDVIKKCGFVTEEAYNGNNIDFDKHNHGEMSAVIDGMLDGVLKRKSKKLTPRWQEAYNKVLDIYMGEAPKEFEVDGKTVTPESFRDQTGFNPDDYIEFTSYSHHPFYTTFPLEIPDNWTNSNYYNIPLEDVKKIFHYALENGYSIAWDGDVSEKEFSMKKGYAVVPVDEDENAKDEEEDDEDPKPEEEKVITDEMRQKTFDNFTTTDDHLMHLVGLYENQEGTKFYLTKNSWGTRPDRFKHDGYIYMSEAFTTLKMVAFMVHKDAVPQEIRDKFGF